MSMHCKRPYAAFTLLELLVAVSIMSVVSTIGATGFFKITGYWRAAIKTQQINQNASRIFSQIREDLAHALSSNIVGRGISGQTANVEDNRHFWRLSFEDDRIDIPVEYEDNGAEGRIRLLVGYHVERSDSGNFLVRYAEPLNADGASTGERIAFADVSAMRIRYYDGRIWLSQWDQTQNPKAVRISLSMMGDNSPNASLSRVSTFPIVVH